MKKYILLLIGVLLGAPPMFAQVGNADLLLQSPDGKTVKLIWLLKSWSPEITGFDIKRKDGLDNWVKLNAEPILPGISVKKKLSIVEADKTEESKVRDKLFDLLKEKKLKETDNTTYLQQLNSVENKLQETNRMVTGDYDMALIIGFAYVDHTIAHKTDYQYGLFIQGTDKLLASATWNYGEIPDLNVVRDITSRATVGKNGIQVFWTADAAKMKAGYVAGFNIYREGLRLNDSPIVAANNKDLSEFMWAGRTANTLVQHRYSISAQSLFGIEGTIKSYTFDPAEHPRDYRRADVTEISSIGYYFKEGININWTFPRDQEHFLKGFYIEKDNMPDGYTLISPLLDPSLRTFVDHTSSPISSYVRIRVIPVYNDKTAVPGKDRIYSYFPVREPPRPQNLKAKSAMEDKQHTITLTWDTPMAGDDVTESFRVYLWDAVNNRYESLAEKISVKNPTYKYVVPQATKGPIKLAVAGVNRGKVESNPCDPVIVE